MFLLVCDWVCGGLCGLWVLGTDIGLLGFSFGWGWVMIVSNEEQGVPLLERLLLWIRLTLRLLLCSVRC